MHLDEAAACPWCGAVTVSVPRPDLLAAGHPKVKAESVGEAAVVEVRPGGGLFAWIWLSVSLLMLVIFGVVLTAGPEMRVNGRLIRDPGPWHYAAFLSLPALFTLAGLMMLNVRRRLTLTASFVESRLRTLPGVGWTSRLAVHGAVRAFLAPRGAMVNGRPVDAVVVSSGGEEVSFGSFMDDDLKAYLAALINDYYGGVEAAPAPFIDTADPGR